VGGPIAPLGVIRRTQFAPGRRGTVLDGGPPDPGRLLAFSGAALFTGSVIHPHNLAVRHTEHALRRWTRLTVVRVAYYLVVALAALAASSTPIAIVAVLSGLSAPAFQPVQLAVLYGYRSEIVVAAVRWGWLLAPLGLLAAALLR